MKQEFAYYITGEEKRKLTLKKNLVILVIELLLIFSFALYYFLHLFEYVSPYTKVSMLTFLLSLLLFLNSIIALLMRKREYFMDKWMYHHEISIENNVLTYVISFGENRFASSFPVVRVKENENGVFYYKDRLNYIFVPTRVLYQQKEKGKEE